MSEASLEELYVAYFGRAADPAGLEYWLIEEDLGTPDSTIALQFVPQAETLSLYPLLDNPAMLATSSAAQSTFVNAVYENLFGHQADLQGLAYWQSQLNSKASPGFMVLQIIAGALGSDKTAIQNKAAAAGNYTNAFANASNPALTWDASVDPAQSHATLATVTSVSTTVTAATPIIAADIALDQAASTGTGVTLTLGNGGQTFSPTAIGGLQTTANDDTIRGTLGGSAPGTAGASELTTSDSINETGGLNTLNTVLDNEADVDPVLTNVELVNLAPGVANQTFNAASSSGTTLLTLSGGIFSPGDGEIAGTTLNVTGIATGLAVGMANAKGFADNLTVAFNNLGATANSASLTLTSNVAGGIFDTTLSSGVGVNIYNIKSSGANPNLLSIGANDTQLTTMNISGSDALTLTNLNTAVTLINGGNATGSLTITTGALVNSATIAGGSGNDTLNASTATKAVAMSDGTGVDTMIFNGAVAGNVITGGGGRDTIQTGGTIGLSFISAADVATNAQLTADVNVLNSYVAGATTIDLKGLSGTGYAIDAINATSLATALTGATTLAQAVNAVAALVNGQGLMTQVVAFAFGGNEYVYQDATGAAGLSAGDGLLQVTNAALTFKASDLSLA
jgi:hypothetical protein